MLFPAEICGSLWEPVGASRGLELELTEETNPANSEVSERHRKSLVYKENAAKHFNHALCDRDSQVVILNWMANTI